MQHNTALKTDTEICNRLRRVEGQIRGIIRMLEEHRSCEEIITQVLAARSAMDKAAAEILTQHVDECLGQMEPSEARSMISRAVQLINKIS